MDIKIVTAEQLLIRLTLLATLARKEGYDLIDKLIEEYRTGKTVSVKIMNFWPVPMMVIN